MNMCSLCQALVTYFIYANKIAVDNLFCLTSLTQILSIGTLQTVELLYVLAMAVLLFFANFICSDLFICNLIAQHSKILSRVRVNAMQYGPNVCVIFETTRSEKYNGCINILNNCLSY